MPQSVLFLTSDPAVEEQAVYKPYLYFVDIGWVVSHSTANSRGLTAAVRHKPHVSKRVSPVSILPICRAVTATAHQLFHSMETEWENRENSGCYFGENKHTKNFTAI